ncbi:MAG: NAD(P) transhydrogenase subunit alpha [Acidobacteria bacterium]|nr:NAD(P) transhydrogenase subunit alpha [Acidobacteriota bacterium]
MKIGALKNNVPGDRRAAIIPATVKKFTTLGAEVLVQAGIGKDIYFTDNDYKLAGANIYGKRDDVIKNSDILLGINIPDMKSIDSYKPGTILASYLDPWNQKQIIKKLKSQKISAISMEFIPRSTIAQKMDALSSQASLAGYAATIIAAEKLDKVLPIMMTAAGTLSPATVLVIGAGVAGLQAIATAKRLGARVFAYDTRPETAETIQSLGAKALKIDIGKTESTKQGYAKELKDAQIKKQRDAMAKFCADSDIIITTARVFGKKSPIIITKDMVKGMKPGSVIMDLAVESGGNVEGAKLDEEVDVNGVKIIGFGKMSNQVAISASEMYSNNLYNLIQHFWDTEKKEFILDMEDDIIKHALLTYNGEILNETFK